jgi:hypothetical protein
VSDAGRSRPRWDPDDQGVGVGDARAHLATLGALRAVADRVGWVAESPETHLLPRLTVIAETTSLIRETRGPDGDPMFEVMTGLLQDDTRFATHGHTLQLRVHAAADPSGADPDQGA